MTNKMVVTAGILMLLGITLVESLSTTKISPLIQYRTQVLSSSSSPPSSSSSVDLFYDSQSIDHFVGKSGTFSQRYFVNDTFFDKNAHPKAPVFLCVGGEGPALDNSVVVSSVHCDDAIILASKLNALIVALEHRYYGISYPTPDFTTENLRFLSAHQALADIAQFQSWFQTNTTEKYELTADNPWVTWGGSYPGMLAGWYRLQFPSNVVAAVSSSAPVKAQLDFKGYNDVVAYSLSASSVGGSSDCLAAVVEGHRLVGAALLTEEGRASLAEKFNLCDQEQLNDHNNQADWAGNGVIIVPSQENDPSCTSPGCNIASICSIMLDSSMNYTDELDALAAVWRAQTSSYAAASSSSLSSSLSCLTLDHNASISSLFDTSLLGGVNRLWEYQTCSEFGFYQTCELDSNCPYTRGLNNLDSQTDLCQQAFDIDAATIQKRIDFSNAFWGADKPGGSRILYPNGSIDPWHALGVLVSPSVSLPILNVEGASHHAWTHPESVSDSAALKQARIDIWNQVTEWLQEAKTEREQKQEQ